MNHCILCRHFKCLGCQKRLPWHKFAAPMSIATDGRDMSKMVKERRGAGYLCISCMHHGWDLPDKRSRERRRIERGRNLVLRKCKSMLHRFFFIADIRHLIKDSELLEFIDSQCDTTKRIIFEDDSIWNKNGDELIIYHGIWRTINELRKG